MSSPTSLVRAGLSTTSPYQLQSTVHPSSTTAASSRGSDITNLFPPDRWENITSTKCLENIDAERLIQIISQTEDPADIRNIFRLLHRIDITALFVKILENNPLTREARPELLKLQNTVHSPSFPRIVANPCILSNHSPLKVFIPNLLPTTIQQCTTSLPQSFLDKENTRRLRLFNFTNPSVDLPTEPMTVWERLEHAKNLADDIERVENENNGIYSLDQAKFKEWRNQRQKLATHYLDNLPTTSIMALARNNPLQLIPFLSSMRWRHLAVAIPLIPGPLFNDVAYRLLETAQRERMASDNKDDGPFVTHYHALKNPETTGTFSDQIKVLEYATLAQKDLFLQELTIEKIEKLKSWGLKREQMRKFFEKNETTPELLTTFDEKWPPGPSESYT